MSSITMVLHRKLRQRVRTSYINDSTTLSLHSHTGEHKVQVCQAVQILQDKCNEEHLGSQKDNSTTLTSTQT